MQENVKKKGKVKINKNWKTQIKLLFDEKKLNKNEDKFA